MDRFDNPLMPHFWGNYYFQEQELDAAVRHYQWALKIAPTFAPSYYNLAVIEHRRKNTDASLKYLQRFTFLQS